MTTRSRPQSSLPTCAARAACPAHALFGWSLVDFRLLAILVGAGTILVAALVARELGGRRAQVLAAIAVGFSPLLVAGGTSTHIGH
jgi:4-amino-4-deoxy-L-arabinose transferase-like glycosyltransferase